MKTYAVVFLLGVMINAATSMIHSLRYFQTASSQIPGFPQYVEVRLVNDFMITYYDSNTKRTVPKEEWMNKVTEDDPQYWERNNQRNLNEELLGKALIETAMQRHNVTGGGHTFQWLEGCDWDDETNEIRGSARGGFDGEDFIALDWDTLTFIAPKQEAFSIKLKWERRGQAAYFKYYTENICADYLKKYVGYGEKTLKRKELPQVSFLQKSSLSPVICHATGFYPKRAMLFWTKDDEELHEDPGEILPNHDGTFQSSVSLDLTSVPTEDWGRYSCVFRLSGVPDDLLTKLDPNKIRTNEKKYTLYIAAAASVLGAVLCAVIGFFVYRKYKAKQLTPQSSEPEGIQLNPQPPVTQ